MGNLKTTIINLYENNSGIKIGKESGIVSSMVFFVFNLGIIHKELKVWIFVINKVNLTIHLYAI